MLERLAQVPDPRDPRGVRHTLAVVLTLTACAVLTAPPRYWRSASGSQTRRRTCWSDSACAPIHYCPEGSCPRRRRSVGCLPASTVMPWTRRWADGLPTASPRAPSCVDCPWTASPCAVRRRPRGGGSTYSPRWSTRPGWSWPNSTSARRTVRSPASSRCSTPSQTWPQPWSPATRSIRNASTPPTSWAAGPTTSRSSRATRSRPGRRHSTS